MENVEAHNSVLAGPDQEVVALDVINQAQDMIILKSFLAALVLWLICQFSLFADEPEQALAKVPRVIKKQPQYQGKPGYLLFVFSDDLREHRWLVVDGNRAYFDRLGNGDLTHPDNRLDADQEKSTRDELYFSLGDLTIGKVKHCKLAFTVNSVDQLADREDAPPQVGLEPKARVLYFWGEFEIPGFTGRCAYGRVPRNVGPYDKDGYLLLENDLNKARIVQFGSQWSVQLDGQQKVFQGTEKDIILNVGSRGWGGGTFAKLGYEKVIPEDIHPRISVTFPRGAGSGLQEHQQTLKERC